MERPRDIDYRTTNSATITFDNITTQRRLLAAAAGLEHLKSVGAEIQKLLKEATKDVSTDPVTGRSLYQCTVGDAWPSTLEVKLFNGHFIRVAATFDAKIQLRSTVPFRYVKSDGDIASNENVEHEVTYDGIEHVVVGTDNKQYAFVMQDPTIKGVLVRDVILDFLWDARDADEYADSEECFLCRHEEHSSSKPLDAS